MTDESNIIRALAAVNRLAGSGNWVVGGSAGLLLRGFELPAKPRDLDLYCDEEDMRLLHDRLRPYAIDVPAYSETDIYRSWLSHYELEGVRVELVGGFRVTAFDCFYRTEVREVLLPLGLPVTTDGLAAASVVVPLAHELWFNALRGRPDRVKPIAEAFAADPSAHQKALGIIEARNSFSPDAVSEVHRWISSGSEEGDGGWMLKSSSGLAANPFA